MDNKYRIIISERDTNARIKNCAGINNSRNFSIADSYSSTSTTLAGIQKLQPDALLINLDPPKRNNVNLICKATDAFQNLRVMVISASSDERDVIEAIESGACSYILKDSNDKQILEAIEQLIIGNAPMSPAASVHLLKRFHKKTPNLASRPIYSLLTEREEEVLQLLAKGFTYTEISKTLNVSINTTRVHTKNLFYKLCVHSRGEAVYEAVEKGILSLH